MTHSNAKLPDISIESIQRALDGLGPPQDQIEIRMRDWDQIPAECQTRILRAGVAIQVDPLIPPGIVLQCNLTNLKKHLTSPLEKIGECFTIIDLRKKPG